MRGQRRAQVVKEREIRFPEIGEGWADLSEPSPLVEIAFGYAVFRNCCNIGFSGSATANGFRHSSSIFRASPVRPSLR